MTKQTGTTQKPKTLSSLEAGDCKWPIGDPRQTDFHFCGAQQVIGRPYCAHHWPLSFVPTVRSRQQARQLPIRQAA